MAVQIPPDLAKPHGGAKAHEIGASWAATFVAHGGLTGEMTVLDIGCGPGRMAMGIGDRFAYANPFYLGFDITQRDIEWATANISARHPQFRFLQVDIRNAMYNPAGAIDPCAVRFPAGDRAFDFIFATSVFTHMRTKEMLVYLDEARRCLAPGGKFFATYYLLEEAFRGRLAPDRDCLSHPLGEHCYTARPQEPEKWITFDSAFVLAALKARGFDVTLYRGQWSRIAPPTGRHAQDYIVARAQ